MPAKGTARTHDPEATDMSMTSLAILAATSLLAMAPQDPPQDPPAQGSTGQGQDPLLDASSLRGLNKMLVAWLSAHKDYDEAQGNARARKKASAKRLKAKEKFEKEFLAKSSKKGNLLASMADIRAIYHNCFEIAKPPKGTGQLRKTSVKFGEDTYEYHYYLPKKYKPANPMPTVVVLPSKGPSDKWLKAGDYFEVTWEETAASATTIFHMPSVAADLDMDHVPDFQRDGEGLDEMKRFTCVLATLGEAVELFNVEYPRVFVDCGRGTSAFGARFMSVFPDRFAGLILRDPTALEGIRLGSLTGKPVLMIKTADNAQVVDDLAKRFEEVSPGKVTVLEATDEFPFKGSADAIKEWMEKPENRRSMVPGKVVIEPNHNRFHNAYWVRVTGMNPIHTSAAENMPRIEVVADRPGNRIVVTAVGVTSFELLLNDDIVDLDKEFTVVVNDKAVIEKKTRSAMAMYDLMRRRRDWEVLFPVLYESSVPK